MVRLGTKWASMTSTCSQSAVATASACSPSRAKSADRMLGAIIGSGPTAGSLGSGADLTANQCEEHRICAVAVRPELHGRAVTELREAGQQRTGIDELRPGNELAGLRGMRRTCHVA